MTPTKCPACRQNPSVYATDTEAWVECHCGIRGPAVALRDVPMECYALGTSRESAAEDGAAYAWDQMDAHRLATGEDSAWVHVLEAVRDALTARYRELCAAQSRAQAAESRSATAERALAARVNAYALEARELHERVATLHADLTAAHARLDKWGATRERVEGAGRFELLEMDT